MPLLAAGAAVIAAVAAVALILAVQSMRAQRALADQLRAVRRQLRDVSGRLESAEKSADDAATRAEVAGKVLLDKGLANEEDLEAARRRFDAPEDEQPVRGSRTLH